MDVNSIYFNNHIIPNTESLTTFIVPLCVASYSAALVLFAQNVRDGHSIGRGGNGIHLYSTAATTIG